jgi:CDP-diacylglycerol pyrophosphatase
MKSAWIRLVTAGVIAATALATFGSRLGRLALWPVVRACVADFELTGAPFPCLEVDLSGGEERGNVVLRPPLLHDLIVAPTRKIVGIEDRAAARSTELFRCRLARAIVPQGRGRTGAGPR